MWRFLGLGTVAAALQTGSPLHAQSPLLRPARGMVEPEVLGIGDLALADLDADGDLDLFTAGGLSFDATSPRPTVHLYDDLGGYRELDGAVDPAVGVVSRAAAALGDLDGDGTVDAFRVRQHNGHEPTWNENTGTPGQPFAGEAVLAPSFFQARDVETFDADADGDPDVLFATLSGLALLRNDLAAGFADVSASLPPHAVGDASDVAVGDLDGDGDEDFVHNALLLSGDARYLVYLQGPGGVFADGTALTPPDLAFAADVAAGDVDGDDDVDLVGMELVGRVRVLTNHTRQLARRGLPRVGKDLALDVSGPGGEPWALAISPGTASLPLPPFGLLQLDPAGLQVVASGALDARGRAAAVGPMPPGPGSVGLTVYAQAVVGIEPRLTNLEIVALTSF